MFHLEPHRMWICTGNTGQLQRHFILSEDDVPNDHPKSFHELMLIAPAVPTLLVTTWIGSKVMVILSPSILLKMTACWLIFLEMASLVGCIFQPLWTRLFSPLWRTCSRRGLMWFCWGGKAFHILGTLPSINTLPSVWTQFRSYSLHKKKGD